MAIDDSIIDAFGQINLHGPGKHLHPTEAAVPGAIEDPKFVTAKAENEAAKEERNAAEDDFDDDINEEITYKPYRPSKLTFGRDHPDPVVENSTLSAVAPPDVKYNLAMPADIIADGKLSAVQLEAVVYGCQRHSEDLPTIPSSNGDPPYRAGFLLGDSAGTGKGRVLGGFVLENITRGRKKHIWISVSNDLYEDAKRDLTDLGLGSYAKKNCFNLGELKRDKDLGKSAESTSSKGKSYDEGVMFLTYSTLIAKGRLDQVKQWCGEDPSKFDGLILLDECHKCKTIELDGNGNPKKSSSKTAVAIVELQKFLPRSRIVYCSATSVSEPKNLGFMSRLGLWGPGTEHYGFNEFIDNINKIGTGAVELNAMHLKSQGALQARTLSYSSCDFEIINVDDGHFSEVYEKAAKIWVDLFAELKKRGMKMTFYWAEHQRFFKNLLVASKVDKAIALTKQAIVDGHCCVIGIQSTGEASSSKAIASASSDESVKKGHVSDGFLSAPCESLKALIKNTISDETELQWWMDRISVLDLPPNNLDRLLNELGGPRKVAELTGRNMRQVLKYDSAGQMKVSYEKRNVNNLEEKAAFQNGDKLIAIVSEAASTGISLHADKRVKNQRRRVHITLELPWAASSAIQQLGRTHRSNQSSGPFYKILISSGGGEARFVSTIAKRLASLGALTQGDRRATGSASALGLVQFDIDNKYGFLALQKLLWKIRACSNTVNIDATDELYFDGIKTIDDYLLRTLSNDTNGMSESTEASIDKVLSRCKPWSESRLQSVMAMDGQTTSTLDGEDLALAKESGLNVACLCNIWLASIDVNSIDFPTMGNKPDLVAKATLF